MRTAPLLLAATAALPALAADLTIDDVAPPDAWFVLRVNDFSAMSEALRSTPLGAIVERDDVSEWLEDQWENDAFAELREEFAKLDIEPSEFPLPAGHAGLSVWGEAPDPENELALPATHYLVLADFDDGAEEMFDLMVESAEEEEKEGAITIEFDEQGDYQIMSVISTFDPDAQRREMIEEIRRDREQFGDDLDDDFWNEMEQNILDSEFDPIVNETHAARAGRWILITSDRDRLADALDVLDGDELDSIADVDDLADLRARVRGAHADLVLMPAAIGSFLDLLNEGAGFFFPEGLLETLGLDQIQGAALALSFDAPGAQAEINFAMPMSGDEGLFSLVELVDTPATPAFVPAESASFTSFAIDWAGVLPFARGVIMTMPEDERAMVEGQFAAFSIAAGPILQSLGPEIVTYTAYQRPLAAASEKSLFALQVVNEAVVSGAINQYGQMMGLEARDFLGSQIFEPPAMMGVPFAVGLGRGWAFIGEAEEIENALRRMSNEDPGALGQTDAYRDATAELEPGAMSYSYADLVTIFEFQQWVAKNIEPYIRATLQDEWMDEEFLDWMIEDFESNPFYQAMRTAPDIAEFRDAVGPLVQEIRADEDGVTGRVLLLHADDK